jgi:hypothetical protein
MSKRKMENTSRGSPDAITRLDPLELLIYLCRFLLSCTWAFLLVCVSILRIPIGLLYFTNSSSLQKQLP